MYKWHKRFVLCAIFLTAVVLSLGCAGGNKTGGENKKLKTWLAGAQLEDKMTKEELYQAALKEGTLVVYSVSGRAFQAKEGFEKEYPGLNVEIKDIRSNDVVDMLKENYEKEDYACDVVICSDCDGSLYQELVEPGIIYTYVPWDMKDKIKEGNVAPELNFLGEAMLIFYNTEIYGSQPIRNIWELTEADKKGRIMMSSPLSSFSTYGFCAQVLKEDEALRQAYREYCGKELSVPEGMTAGEVFWEMAAANINFVNSNDEVLEGIGNSTDAEFGIMISSKLRYQNLGYHFEPIRHLEPFSSVYTPNCIALAGGSENISCAKLFIRYVLGEKEGDGEGYSAFATEGTWSFRTDVPDRSTIPLSDLDMIEMDKKYLYDNRESITEFFGKLLEENIH